MFGFMVTADGGLTTSGYVITVIAGIILFFLAIYFCREEFRQEKAYHKTTGILCRSYCTCFYYVLFENL